MKKLIVIVVAGIFASISFAIPNSWIATRYRPNIVSSGSTYRSPLTDGHLDIRLFVDNVTFTDAVFTINYDSNIVNPIGTGSVTNIRGGLSLVSVTTEDLDGSWKKATITLTGNITIGTAEYEQDSIFVLRFIPHSEGVMPITLWQADYPDSYTTCALSLYNGEDEVIHERKEWNDGTNLFTFTDKTTTLNFNHDIHFLYPLEGYLVITYSDQSTETYYQTDTNKGIAYYPDYSLWLVAPQPNATEYTVYLPGYSNYSLTFTQNMYTSHSQPESHIFIDGVNESSPLRASTEDVTLTAGSIGVGEDFATSEYEIRIAGYTTGELSKSFTFAPVDNDNIQFTIIGGLADPDYLNLYLFKNDEIVGRTWFSSAYYYPATFNVTDAESNPIEGALVRFVKWGMEITLIDIYTDASGEAEIDLAGEAEWGMWHEFYVVAPSYDLVSSYAEVYDSAITIPVQLIKAQGFEIGDFATLADYWGDIECFWGDCNVVDFNVDGVIDTEDLILFAARWLQYTIQ